MPKSSNPESVARCNCIFYGWIVAAWLVIVRVMKCQGQNNIMAYTVPYLLEDFSLSHSELGMLFSLATVSSSLVQPIFGRALDRFGARVCIPIAQVVLSLTLLSFSVARQLAQLGFVYLEVVALFFFLRGLSLGALETFPGACMQKWFVRRRGRAISSVATSTQMGQAVMAPLISGLVTSVGWRQTAHLGGLMNVALSIPSAMILRSTPEALGLLPDGDSQDAVVVRATVVVEDCETNHVESEAVNSAKDAPRNLWPLFLFTFFYALMFGGCDFEMVMMVREAGGDAGGVSVAMHIFLPLALTSASCSLIVGEMMDRCNNSVTLVLSLLGFCGTLTFAVTNLLLYAGTPAIALTYSVLRGITQAMNGALLSDGIAFNAFGVERSVIGGALGTNRLFILAGTGFGPLVYGTLKDLLKNFRLGLRLSSIPPLLLGAYFLVAALMSRSKSTRAIKGYAKADSELPGKMVEVDLNVIGKSASEDPDVSEKVAAMCAGDPTAAFNDEDAEESYFL